MILTNNLLKDQDFAYFCGVLAGDGHIGFRENKKEYVIQCAGNAKDEISFYNEVLIPLIDKLFEIKVEPKYFDRSRIYGFRIYSKRMFKFLVDCAGLPHGKKYDQLRIPEWCTDDVLIRSYVQGLADTDFCITFKKRGKSVPYYPCIIGSSKSKRLFKEVELFIKNQGLKPTCIWDYKIKDSRFKQGYSLINRVELNGVSNLNKWMLIIGFRSPKHLSKIKKYGKKNSGEWI